MNYKSKNLFSLKKIYHKKTAKKTKESLKGG